MCNFQQARHHNCKGTEFQACKVFHQDPQDADGTSMELGNLDSSRFSTHHRLEIEVNTSL